MKEIKIGRVLIALDYDPSAQKVAEVGFSVAKSMNADVTLLHVITDSVFYTTAGYSPIMGFTGYVNTGELQLNSIEGLKKASQDFLDKSKHHLGDKSIQTLVKTGDCAEAILQTAKDMHIDIIIMGSHSRKWLENIMMGSVAEEVLRNTTIPLFIIPTKKNK